MIILGIETSCDDTAAAVVEDGFRLLSHELVSQIDIHKAYGGVVPEIAARSHIEAIHPVIARALSAAFLDQQTDMISTDELRQCMDQVDAIGVTHGAGLAGSLLVGVNTARILAAEFDKPLYAINHVEGHVYANFLTESKKTPSSTNQVSSNGAAQPPRSAIDIPFPGRQPELPMLALTASGKHTQLVYFRDHGDYDVLGRVVDDAAGEAFDKFARVLGLPPNGRFLAECADQPGADETAFDFPKARLEGRYDFSFSGVKTAGLRQLQQLAGVGHDFPSFDLHKKLPAEQIPHLAASFQRVICETMVDKLVIAYEELQPKSVVIAGGVASSRRLRQEVSARIPLDVEYAHPSLCVDNGAMIATLTYYRAQIDDPIDPSGIGVHPTLKM